MSSSQQARRADATRNYESLLAAAEEEFAERGHSASIADIARRVILVVLFDNRTTLGLVRLKMKHTVDELTKLFQEVFQRGSSGTAGQSILAGAEDEIDKLFQ